MRYDKKILMLITIFTILLSMNIVYGKENVQTITLEKAKEMAVKNNSDLRAIQFSLDRIEVDRESLENNIVNATTQINAGTARAIALEQEINTLLAGGSSELDVAHLVAEFNLIVSQSSRTGSLYQNLDLINNQVDGINDSKDIQIAAIEFNIENQYITLLYLDTQLLALRDTINNMERFLEVERLKLTLGLGDNLKLENTFINVRQLRNNLSSLKVQKDNLENNFKLIIGVKLNEDIYIEDLQNNNFVMPNLKNDIDKALKDGLVIKNHQSDLERKERYVDDLTYLYKVDSSTIRKEEIGVKETKAKLEDVKESLSKEITIAYNNMILSKEALDLKGKELEVLKQEAAMAELKFNIGMISRLELLSKETDFRIKQQQNKQAEYDLIKAVSNYDLVKKGVIITR